MMEKNHHHLSASFFWGFAEMNPQKNPHVSIQKITTGIRWHPAGCWQIHRGDLMEI
jgi:hypothetical protein